MMTKDEIKDKLYALHGASSRNLEQVKKSTTCGCFCCGSIFKNEDIEESCDNDGKGDRTAICPKCHVDSVLGDACGYEISSDLLSVMHTMYFGEGIDNIDANTVSLALRPSKLTLNLRVFDQTCTYLIPSAKEASYRAAARKLNSVYEEMKKKTTSFSQSELLTAAALMCTVRLMDKEV